MYSFDNCNVVHIHHKGAKYLMKATIVIGVIMTAVLIYSFFYVTKKGYSRKWDEEE